MARVKLSIARRLDMFESRESRKLAFFVKTSQELCQAVPNLFEISIGNPFGVYCHRSSPCVE